jgi:hypothetical protein
MPVYRYKHKGLRDAELQSATGGDALTISEIGNAGYIDVAASAAQKSDLDAAMLDQGFVFDTQDPVTTVVQVSAAQIDHTALLNKGTNTHAQIDTHIGSTSNPHSVTKAQVGLSNVLDAVQEVVSAKNSANGYAGLDASSKLNGSQQTYGSSANTACEGNDARLSDARTPTAHNQAETTITFTDITTGNATTLVHGYLPKLGGGTTNFLRADGTWSAPAASGGAWGTITGTLSDQTDLQTALNGKADNATTLAGYGITDAAPLTHVGAGGTAHADVIAAGASGFMSGADKTKLDGIATGATANSSDAVLLNRDNHTGSQATSTITGLDTALSEKEVTANKGAANGYAGLTASKLTNGAWQVYGSSANTACEGNDARLSDARTPTAHTHGNITNAGAIGSTANLPIITTTSGVLTVGSFGSSVNTFCQGNDARLSDARTPTSHVIATNLGLGGQHTISGASAGHVLRASSATAANFQQLAHGDLSGIGTNDHATIDTHLAATAPHSGHEQTANKNATNGYAGLAGGKLAGTQQTYGSAANTACEGNDTRLSNARTPVSHVLATNLALGTEHTISGASAGHVLRASSATAANFQQLAHTDLSSIGTNTHAQIDTHIASTSNPHSVTAAQVGALATTAFSGVAKISVGTVAPVGPAIGDLWIDTN